MATDAGTKADLTGMAAQSAPPAKPEPLLNLVKRTVIDVVAAKVQQFIENGELNLPNNYSVNNAIKAAWLILQATEDKDHNKAMAVCTRDSIANSLLDMVVQGLNPMKKQAYFIVYGKTLTCQRSYFGSMAVAQMVNPKISEFAYAVVYEGDKFTYGIQNGKKNVTLHEQNIDNVDKTKIKAAYCIALDKDGNPLRTEIATFEEIKQSWRQSKMSPIDEKGNVKEASTHGKFTSEMALKTVINKCCKAIINASSDNALLLERINRNEDLSDRAGVEAEIEEEANKGEVLEIEAGPEEVEEVNEAPSEKEEAPKTETKRAPGF
jgi:recombination protein RecT